MPKQNNVTDAELGAALEALDDAGMALQGISERIARGYVDDLTSLPERVRLLNRSTRTAAELLGLLLFQIDIAAQRAERDRLLSAAADES